MKDNTAPARCTSTCYATRIRLAELADQLGLQYALPRHRDVLYWRTDTARCFVFEFGVAVVWADDDQAPSLGAQLAPFCEGLHAQPLADEFTYRVEPGVPRIHSDHISLNDDQLLTLLGVSHGLAQSSKLEEFEAEALASIEKTAQIPRNIAERGSSKLSRRTIARMRGELFLVESDINLHSALLDTPEFFWEYPELEGLYTMSTRYLDVNARIEVLNRKLGTIHNLFTMLAEEQKHRHSSLLEWIIIWLIAIEIGIFVYEDLLGLV